MNIYVGNLSYETGETAIQELFEKFGPVQTVSVITDKFTGRPRGFAFVEMADQSHANKAIEGLNGIEVDEREIVVHEARPRTERSNNGGGRKRY